MERRDLTGSTIAGRYRVLRRLGAGGMGAVWLVQHAESLQHYALKTLHPELSSDELSAERFLREARAAAALRSRHVVRVVDAQMNHVDERGARLPFMVMELLEGQNLEQLLAHAGPLAREEVVFIVRQVARALDAAHQKGIVHRDLKPENVFLALDEEGETVTKVCDFGIAKLAGDAALGLVDRSALGTKSGTTVGTPMYMSPEQARSSPDIGVESDQWAVGLIAFKALTGREYFGDARTTAELLLRIVNDPLVPPSRTVSSLPAAFDAWFLRSCARDPKARFASAGEQANELQAALDVVEPRAPKVVPNDAALAMAETVNASSVKPPAASPPQQVTTGAPASRASAAPPPKSRSFVLYALLGVAGVGAIAAASFALGERDAARSVGAAPAGSVSFTTSKPIAPPPVPVVAAMPKPDPLPSVSASASSSAASKGLPKGARCAHANDCATGLSCIAEECR